MANGRTISVRLRVQDDGTVVLRNFGRQVNRTTNRVDEDFQRTNRSTRDLVGSFGALRAAVATLGLGLLARRLLQVTDRMKELRTQLRIVTDTEVELNQAFEGVLRVANETRTALDPTINLFARMARSTKELNTSQADLLQVTRTINQAFIVSGATAQEASNAIIQLSQGFASGQLRGEEFRSVAEQAPRLLEAVAEALDKTRGELMEMAFAGELTTEVFFEALLGQAELIDREFSQVSVTVSQATSVLGNNMSVLIADFDRATGASSALADTILQAAAALRDFNDLAAGRGVEDFESFLRVATLRLGPINDALFNIAVAFRDNEAAANEAREAAIVYTESVRRAALRSSADLEQSTEATQDAAEAMEQLEAATGRLNEQQKRAVDDARAFAAAQQEIIRAQFEARAPGLDTDERARQQEEVNNEIKRLQEDLFTEELRIARRTADERLRLLESLITDEEKLAKGRLAVEIDLANATLAIEKKKRDEIKKQLIGALNEERRLRELAARAGESAGESFGDEAPSQNDRLIQLREEATELNRIGASLEERIAAWERFNEAAEGSVLAQQQLRDLQRQANELADEQANKEAEALKQQQEKINKSAEAQRKFTDEQDLQAKVSVDDSEFQAFLEELATPSEHTVRITAEQNRSQGGPILRRALGGGVPGGWGGGDRVRAMLEPGEYVLRKEAVRSVGMDYLEQFNRYLTPPPIYRQEGGPVGDLPAGGSGSGARDVVDLNLSLDGQRISGTVDREFANGLARALRGLQSSVAGGV